MRTGIIIITYNLSAEIFLLQIAAIRKFCTDEFTIEVFDNSDDLEKAEHIRYHAQQLEVRYRKTFSAHKGGSDSHSFVANFSYQLIKTKYDLYAYFDHDLIPVKPFSVMEILSGGHVMAGVGQGTKKKYMWPGCVLWNATAIDRNMIDFGYSHDLSLDTGGMLYKVIEKYGEENCIFFNESYHQNPHFHNKEYEHYAMINNEMFMHFVAGSNWVNLEEHDARINSLINIAKEKTGL